MTAKELRAEYVAEFPHCQYTAAVGPYVNLPRSLHRQLCVEHIWGRRSRSTQDHWSNYATTADGPHRWKHANLLWGRICISAYKLSLMKSTGDPRHFDRAALRDAAGFDVVGWIAVKLETVEMPSWVSDAGLFVVESF